MQRMLVMFLCSVLLLGASGLASTRRYNAAKTYATHHSNSRRASA
jgi:hypothetical protein